MEFEWDEAKALANLDKHRIDFEDAAQAFFDPRRIERVDVRRDYGEQRLQTLACVDGRILFIVYTERLGTIRLISARKAAHKEQETYETNNPAKQLS